jgi:hypothetical protein
MNDDQDKYKKLLKMITDKNGKRETTFYNKLTIIINCKAGDLLYCKRRTTTECCFNNHSCESNWDEINRSFGSKAIAFLKDKVSSSKTKY